MNSVRELMLKLQSKHLMHLLFVYFSADLHSTQRACSISMRKSHQHVTSRAKVKVVSTARTKDEKGSIFIYRIQHVLVIVHVRYFDFSNAMVDCVKLKMGTNDEAIATVANSIEMDIHVIFTRHCDASLRRLSCCVSMNDFSVLNSYLGHINLHSLAHQYSDDYSHAPNQPIQSLSALWQLHDSLW
jgi:hypothetical protein